MAVMVREPNAAAVAIGAVDPDVLEDLTRIAVAAGVSHVACRVGRELAAHWSRAPMILVDGSAVDDWGVSRWPHRSHVYVAARAGEDVTVVEAEQQIAAAWQVAHTLGAEQPVILPRAEHWLVARLSSVCSRAPGAATVIGVMGAVGGAGVSSLACALAVAGARDGRPAALCDVDPLGVGLDALMGIGLGADHDEGLGWADLRAARGRVSPVALMTGLPQSHGVTVCGWGNRRRDPVAGDVCGSVIDGLAAASDLVVIDIPRGRDRVADEAIARTHLVLLVVPTNGPALRAAARLAAEDHWCTVDLHVVLAGPSKGIAGADVARDLDLPVLSGVPYDPQLGGDLAVGLPPGAHRRSRLGRAAAGLLKQVRGHVAASTSGSDLGDARR